MKLKKRKIKYSAIFFLCWFAVLVFLVDGVLKFQTLVDYFGSYAFVEISLALEAGLKEYLADTHVGLGKQGGSPLYA